MMINCPKCQKEVATIYRVDDEEESCCYACHNIKTASYEKSKKLCNFLNDLKFERGKYLDNKESWIAIDIIQTHLRQMTDEEIDKIFD